MPIGRETPTHSELAQLLRGRIERGEIRAGDTLPPITDLMDEYSVSRSTVRSAITQLASEGVVRTAGRKGTFVQPRPERRRIRRSQIVTRSSAGMYVFPAASYADEIWVTHGVPKASYEPAPRVVTDKFEVEAEARVLRRRRVMSPEGEPPFQIVDTWLSPQAVADAPRIAEPSTGPGGYLDRLEEAGHAPIEWTESTRARMPSSEEARLLEMPTALPVLEIVLVGRSGRDNQPLEVTIRVIPADRVELVSELVRDESAAWPREGRR